MVSARRATFSEGVVGGLLEDRSAVLLGPIIRAPRLSLGLCTSPPFPSTPMQSSKILLSLSLSVDIDIERIRSFARPLVRRSRSSSALKCHARAAGGKFLPSGNDEREERKRGGEDGNAEWRDNVRQITTNYEKEEEDEKMGGMRDETVAQPQNRFDFRPRFRATRGPCLNDVHDIF